MLAFYLEYLRSGFLLCFFVYFSTNKEFFSREIIKGVLGGIKADSILVRLDSSFKML